MAKQHQTDHGTELERAFARWDYLYEHGRQDPGYADGVNLNLIRNHVIYHRRQLEETPTLFGFPECYYREIPPEVDNNFMARPNEIRTAARASLEAYRAAPDYQFILAHREEIPPKTRDKLCIGAVLGYVSGLEHPISEDDLVNSGTMATLPATSSASFPAPGACGNSYRTAWIPLTRRPLPSRRTRASMKNLTRTTARISMTNPKKDSAT